MNKPTTLLPVVMILIIAVITIMMIMTGRSNAPSIAGDADYPHYVCTFNSYCVGSECTPDKGSFVVYLAHANGRPRIELDGMNPTATLVESPEMLLFESRGGAVSGTLSIFADRKIDFIATSGAGDTLLDHFGAGQCDRRVTP